MVTNKKKKSGTYFFYNDDDYDDEDNHDHDMMLIELKKLSEKNFSGQVRLNPVFRYVKWLYMTAIWSIRY